MSFPPSPFPLRTFSENSSVLDHHPSLRHVLVLCRIALASIVLGSPDRIRVFLFMGHFVANIEIASSCFSIPLLCWANCGHILLLELCLPPFRRIYFVPKWSLEQTSRQQRAVATSVPGRRTTPLFITGSIKPSLGRWNRPEITHSALA